MEQSVEPQVVKAPTLERCMEERKRLEGRFAELTAELERVRQEWHYWQRQAETCGEQHDRYH